MGGLSSKSNSNIVQMRRSTNKKGKQAPAPPKRTRYSESVFFSDRRIPILNIIFVFSACCLRAVHSATLLIKNKINRMQIWEQLR